ncbi:solute carrier family 66 member 2 isoform X2 [Frankliniella occidentalis]|uniref:Solute carrier family 66 member 2 n=1 Tax=Frankliniella occidentalis TaxID=133901 RepID=A0A6J1S3K4_FRAOC|nr:solute carrier family 66 member 2 isoform X2 [Frankliniella occidentalis]
MDVPHDGTGLSAELPEEYVEDITGSVLLLQVIGASSACAMIFGGVVPFIPQYYEIKRTNNSDGFSLYVCLALLVANILRILFWFGKRFETPLLIQSMIMIVTMMVMIRLCVEVRRNHVILKVRDRVLSDMDLRFFWKWTDFQSYVDCTMLMAIVGSIVTYMLLDVPIFVEILGFSALLTEALLGVPQLQRNYISKSTEGMSVTMVLMWTAGDVFKTLYFLVRDAPFQFWLCGILQVSVDMAILSQVHLYRHNVPAHHSSRSD